MSSIILFVFARNTAKLYTPCRLSLLTNRSVKIVCNRKLLYKTDFAIFVKKCFSAHNFNPPAAAVQASVRRCLKPATYAPHRRPSRGGWLFCKKICTTNAGCTVQPKIVCNRKCFCKNRFCNFCNKTVFLHTIFSTSAAFAQTLVRHRLKSATSAPHWRPFRGGWLFCKKIAQQMQKICNIFSNHNPHIANQN